MAGRLNIRNADFSEEIVPDRPAITSKDYQKGVIWRYFAARASLVNMEVHEVSGRNYRKYVKNPTIVTASLRWLIRGKLDDTPLLLYTGRWDGEPETVIVPGVKSQNRASIEAAAEKLPALKLFLSPSQYYVGE